MGRSPLGIWTSQCTRSGYLGVCVNGSESPGGGGIIDGKRYGTVVPGLDRGLGLGQDIVEVRLPCPWQGGRGGGMTPGWELG